MSKLKHLLRKLHLSGGCNDNNNRLAAADTSSWPPATTTPTGAVLSLAIENVNDHSNSSTVDCNFFGRDFRCNLLLRLVSRRGRWRRANPKPKPHKLRPLRREAWGVLLQNPSLNSFASILVNTLLILWVLHEP